MKIYGSKIINTEKKKSDLFEKEREEAQLVRSQPFLQI